MLLPVSGAGVGNFPQAYSLDNLLTFSQAHGGSGHVPLLCPFAAILLIMHAPYNSAGLQSSSYACQTPVSGAFLRSVSVNTAS